MSYFPSPQSKDEAKPRTTADTLNKKDAVAFPRADLTVDDRDRAEHQPKLRGRRQQLFMKSKHVLNDEGKLALKLKRADQPAAAVTL